MAQKRLGGWKWLFLAVAIVAVGIGVWYFNRDDDSAPQYMTASVTRGDLTQVVTATGTLNPVVNVQVGSQISGIIQNLYADFNSSVTVQPGHRPARSVHVSGERAFGRRRSGQRQSGAGVR